MNITEFKDITAGIQSVAVAAAIAIGGLWTIFIFIALKQKKKSEAELFQQAVININVDAKQLYLDDGRGLYIAAVATVSNIGNRNTFLDFTKNHPFKISKISFHDTGHGVLSPSVKMNTITGYQGMTLRRSASQQFHLFVRVSEAGPYLIEFAVGVSQPELEVHQITAADSKIQGEVIWVGTDSVMVEQRQSRVPIN